MHLTCHIVATKGHTGRGVVGSSWPEALGVKRMRPLLPTGVNGKAGQLSRAETCEREGL